VRRIFDRSIILPLVKGPRTLVHVNNQENGHSAIVRISD
jgi:rare lipoprotein A (peptidoglycan hydrolase)